ncbi:MAG: hypothetical protein H8K03_17570 [Nitrospira sp.]
MPYVFESLDQVQEISAEWLQSGNEARPHDALVGLPPAMSRAQCEARNCLLEVSLTGESTKAPSFQLTAFPFLSSAR